MKNNKKYTKKQKSPKKRTFFALLKLGECCVYLQSLTFEEEFFTLEPQHFFELEFFSVVFFVFIVISFLVYTFIICSLILIMQNLSKKTINNLLIVLVMCLFCIITHFCLWDSSTSLGMTAHQRVQAGRSAHASKMCVALF